MPARNKLELAREWTKSRPRVEHFLSVYPYVAMLRGCHIGPDYRPPPELADAFALTASGDQLLELLTEAMPDVDAHSRRLGVAVCFGHQDLYVDVDATNIDDLHTAFSAEVLAGNIQFPQEYGRLLYDRFFEAFPSHTSTLSYEETQSLIADSPTASYQMGFLTVGPLGPAKSKSFRLFPPTHTAPLWHCSDPGCSALHTVKLGTAHASVNLITQRIYRHWADIREAPSEWDGLYRTLSGEHRGFYGYSSMPQLPWLLADAFSEEELRVLVATAFELDPVGVRAALAPVMDVGRAPEVITAELQEQAAFQCLLLLDDRLVVQVIESAVLKKRISVPVTESRRAVAFKSGGGSWWRLTPEVGALGMRSVSPSADFALLRLQKLLLHVGSSVEGPTALDWELRFAPGSTLVEKLSQTMQQETPQTLLRRFVFSSAASLRTTVDYLQPMFFEMPNNEQEESLLLDRILWKLGFAVWQHPPELTTFWHRAEGIHAAIHGHGGRLPPAEEDALRSAAVNYFVSIEDLFDRALAFTGWALLNDHYASIEEARQFSFSLEDAREFVAERLNSAGSGEFLKPNGHNTLWPLIYNFAFLGDHIRSIAASAAADDLRAENELPEFSTAGAAPFPFPHRTPVHDLDPVSVELIARTLCEVSTDLARIDLPNLRNRLEHKRPDSDFPTTDEVKAGLDLVEGCITTLEQAGLLPVLHVFESFSRDQYGRTLTTLRDYAGRAIEIAGPTGSRHGRMPVLAKPQVPMKAAKLREIPDILRFTLSEASTFRSKWANYPRRRLRMGAEVDAATPEETGPAET